jgi:glycosyltransferase involved in cell wall biosynthesis
MRIALYFPAPGGGVQRGQVVLANALAARGIEVMCIMPRARGPFLQQLAPGISLTDLRARHPIIAAVRLARFLRRCRPNALIASQAVGINTAVATRALAVADVPVIGVQHNVLSELCRQSKSLQMRRIVPLLARMFYPLADRIVAVSQGVAADLETVTGVPEDEIAVIPSTTLTPEIPALAQQPTGWPWLDSKSRPVVLAVGNLRPVKDHAMLIRAFARVRRERPAYLVVLGEGEERPKLELLARELGVDPDVHIAGHESNPYAYMARADVLALSSRHEGFGNVLVEAMACGCQVVSTDCPHGPGEILEGGRYGRLVPVGNEAAMATAIMETLDEIMPRVDSAQLPQRAAEFSLDRMVNRYLDVLGEDSLERGRSARAA